MLNNICWVAKWINTLGLGLCRGWAWPGMFSFFSDSFYIGNVKRLSWPLRTFHSLSLFFFSLVYFCWRTGDLCCVSFYCGEGNGTPLQYSCLENPMDGGAWKAVVHGVAEGRTRLSDFTFTFTHWRRKWQPTPVFLPGESQGQGSLVGCCLWGRTESDTTEAT